MNMKHMDEELSLERLLTRCKELPPDENIRIYFDPDTQYFIINYADILPFWLPRRAIKIGRCQAVYTESEIMKIISYAVKKLTEELKS